MLMEFKIPDISSPVRLDLFLSEKLGLSRSRVQKMISRGLVALADGREAEKDLKLKTDDVVKVELPPACESFAEPENLPLDVIHEDEDILVINKGAGMIVHPTSKILTGTVVNALLFRFGKTFSVVSAQRPGIVHRLDKDTSGVMVVAKSDRAYFSLVKQFSARKVHKQYVAFVSGDMKRGEEIETFYGRHPRMRQKMSVWGGLYEKRRGPASKKAVTVIKVLERMGHSTILEVSPRTGRTHQIRVHVSYLGYPVLGDKTYGGKTVLKTEGGDLTVSRQMLHAKLISFEHPGSGKTAEYTAPLPEDMRGVLAILRRL